MTDAEFRGALRDLARSFSELERYLPTALRNAELLAKLSGQTEHMALRMEGIADDFDELAKLVRGNGSEGLTTRVTKVEIAVAAVSRRRAVLESFGSAVIGGVLVGLALKFLVGP